MASKSGTSANDQLIGSGDDDQLYGGSGDDLLHGGGGNDRLEGGDGDDRLDGVEGDDELSGGAGDDRITGGDGTDILDGGAGNDTMLGGSGNDRLEGGDGDDKLVGQAGHDVLNGGTGNDRLYGQDGDDQLYGGAGNDKLYGGSGDDLLHGGGGNDRLHGGGGNDRLEGGDGDDRLDGVKGDDELSGGAGDDHITGGDGTDILDGGAGNDTMLGGSGNDRLEGGDGDDKLVGQAGHDVLNGGTGNDRLYGQDGDDQLYGGAGNDKLYGGSGDDLFTYLTGDGDDYVDGGSGSADTIRLEVDDGWILNLTRGEIVSDEEGQLQLSDSAAGTITLADGSTIRFTDIERIEATESESDDDNRPPTDLGLIADPVEENAANGSVVGTAIATDPDAPVALAGAARAAGGLSYALTDDADGRFAIDPDTGVVTVVDGSRLDYERAAQHSIEVEVTDAGGLSATQTFTIDVADLNEAPIIVELSAGSVTEGAADGTVVGTVGASDPDAGDTLSYALTDDAGGRFAIDPSTGVITVADSASLDHADAAQHDIDIEVTDAAGLSTTRTFTIDVANVNEAPGIVGLNGNEVPEGAANGTVVGAVGASDPDAGDALSYSLADDAGGRFAIDPNTGVITVADGALLDHESAARHGIEVTVTDAGGLSATQAFTIDVGDLNEAPGIAGLSANEVPEGAADGTVVGTVGVSDPDAGDTLTYALTDDAGGRFAIDPDTGLITVAGSTSLDHESASQHSIEVTVTDAGGLSATQAFTIDVDDVNEAPGGLALDSSGVVENAGAGTVVGTVGASDPDAGDTLTYALTDDAGGRFAIDPDTGVVTVADGAAFDHQSAPEHSITVEVTDAGGLGATESYTITVAETNDAPGALGLSGGAVAESALGGTVVGTASATDPNAGDTLTYSLTDDAGGRFAIDPDSGVITVADGALLDHEGAPEHSITVEVTDAGGLASSQSFTVAVTDVNEAPGGLALSASSVPEGASDGTVVGTVGASDPDAGETLSYALTDDAGGRFAIDPDSGVITVADGASLDHDSVPEHSITVEVTDAGGLSATESFTIAVSDVNEVPGGLTLDAHEIAEGAGEGAAVGTVQASDPDAGDTLTYALTDDAGGRFAIDPGTGVITVADGASLDYESHVQHGIEVQVTDAGGLSTTQTFTIDVTNVNEAPGALTLDVNAVAEGADDGTVVGTVAATDPDAGDTLTYALTDDAGGRFTIDPDTGVITVADGALFDHESAAQHGIEVTVTDAAGLSATQTFAIDVTDVNEAPGRLTLDASEVAEDATEGTVIGTVSAVDPDAGDALTYSLSDDAGGRFVIDPDNGVIAVAEGASLDYGAAAQHLIEVAVTDAAGLTTAQTFTIDVLDVNDSPSILGLSSSEVFEGAAGGTVVGTVGASDPNPGDALTYALSDDADGRFAIDPDTGVITVADGTLLDYESAAQHGIAVEVTDASGLSTSQAFTIDVANVNEAPGIVHLDSSEVAEGAPGGTVIGTVGASDPDAGDALTFAFTDDAGGRFAIDPDTGVITVADGASLDYENAMQHSVEVEVSDAGGLRTTQSFMIAVTNVNEQPVLDALSANMVIEGAADGTVIGTVLAIDPDGSDPLTFELTDDSDGRFAIDPDTGVIRVADGTLLDYDDADQHGIEVTVTDADGLSDVATYVIELRKDNSGDDALTGDDDDNLIDGGPGDDLIFGGNGDDHLIGGDGDDFLFGENDDDQLSGGDGNDQLYGGRGDDHLLGGAGNDELYGSVGNDSLAGTDGNDVLYGGAGDDVLAGGAGDDILFGGSGDPGGSGADRFVFASLDGSVDRIGDFRADDVLAIGDLLVGFAEGEEASFIRLVDDGTATTVQVDVDGAANGESYQSIAVLSGITGATGVTVADLVSAGQIDFWMS